MTREQLIAIARRHEEDHRFDPVHSHQHPRPLTWHKDAVGDRAALLEFIAELMGTKDMVPRGSSMIESALASLRPPLKVPRLPRLHARKESR